MEKLRILEISKIAKNIETNKRWKIKEMKLQLLRANVRIKNIIPILFSIILQNICTKSICERAVSK